MNIRSKEARVGDWLVVLICLTVILLCILPMLNLLAQSLSSSDAVINGQVSFLPIINRPAAAVAEQEADLFAESSGFSDWSSDNFSDSDWNDDWNNDWSSDWGNDWSDAWHSDDWHSEDYDYLGDYDFSADYGEDDGVDYSEWLRGRQASADKYQVGVTMESYRYVFLDQSFTRSMWWTAILTVICTLVSLAMTILCAYPLTYDWLKGKILINTLIIFTMYFSAGTIPNYILMKDLGLLNNPLVLIIPNCLSVFNMIILRSFFFGIPDSLRESAEIDGANPFTVLIRIYLPLSAPVLATLALFYAVGRWNGFSDALLYINSAPQWVPIQLKLWQLIQNMTSIDVTTVEMVAGTIPRASDAIKAAAIMFATVPILIVYPWLQRYFIAGVTIGAVKG